MWTADLRIETEAGVVEVGVTKTGSDENGVLIYITENGWNLGSYRSDGLAPILEDIVSESPNGSAGGYRSFTVASASTASMAPISQKRTTVCVSLQPFFWK